MNVGVTVGVNVWKCYYMTYEEIYKAMKEKNATYNQCFPPELIESGLSETEARALIKLLGENDHYTA